MFSSTLVCCLLLSLHLLAAVRGNDLQLPRFAIDLDLPPEERWREIASIYGDGLIAVMGYLKQILSPAYETLAVLGGDLDGYLPEPYASELKGIQKQVPNVTIGELVFFNLIYDLTAYSNKTVLGSAACTSIVAQTTSGKIMHGRNLDYAIDLLRKTAIIVDFQQSGNTVYTMTTFAGYVGAATGQKPNKFTITMDERNTGDWRSNVIAAQHVGTKGLVAFKIRDLLADPDSDFEKVVSTFATSTELVAPVYLIVGGLTGDEGAVITHNRTMGIDVWRLNSSKGRWFLVETNYDHWNPPPTDDNRRDPAENMMNTFGLSGVSSESLFKVLSTPPVLNNRTLFTAVMSASDPDVYTGWIRDSE